MPNFMGASSLRLVGEDDSGSTGGAGILAGLGGSAGGGGELAWRVFRFVQVCPGLAGFWLDWARLGGGWFGWGRESLGEFGVMVGSFGWLVLGWWRLILCGHGFGVDGDLGIGRVPPQSLRDRSPGGGALAPCRRSRESGNPSSGCVRRWRAPSLPRSAAAISRLDRGRVEIPAASAGMTDLRARHDGSGDWGSPPSVTL